MTSDKASPATSRTLSRGAMKVAGIYAFFGFLWILFSDQILLYFTDDPTRLAHLQTFKGWFYVFVTALLLYGLVRLALADQRRVEKSLRQSEERLSLALIASNTGIWDWHIKTGEVFFDANFYRIAGYAPDAFAHTYAAWRERVHPDDIVATEAKVRSLFQGLDEPYIAEFRFRTKSGGWMWILSRGMIFERNLQGKPIRITGTHTDITDRKAAQDKICKLNEELEARVCERTAQLEALNRELEAFSYSVSHDLKAPLRGIDGYSRLLEEDYSERLDEEGRYFIRNIRQGAAQMHELIEDLLDYSRTERRSLQKVPLDLPALVRSVVKDSGLLAGEPDVRLQLDLPPLCLCADREGVVIAVRNLLENAIKFSRGAQPPTIEVGARSEGDKVILWVRDNGIGFDMKFHDRIFDIFQRLQRVEDYPGTGIGLALVRKTAQRMGGRVRAESAPGAGATFFLELPR